MPVLAGLWWKRANLTGGLAAVLTGAVTYVVVHFGVIDIWGLSPILVALPASAGAMLLGGTLGSPDADAMSEHIEELHRPAP